MSKDRKIIGDVYSIKEVYDRHGALEHLAIIHNHDIDVVAIRSEFQSKEFYNANVSKEFDSIHDYKDHIDLIALQLIDVDTLKFIGAHYTISLKERDSGCYLLIGKPKYTPEFKPVEVTYKDHYDIARNELNKLSQSYTDWFNSVDNIAEEVLKREKGNSHYYGKSHTIHAVRENGKIKKIHITHDVHDVDDVTITYSIAINHFIKNISGCNSLPEYDALALVLKQMQRDYNSTYEYEGKLFTIKIKRNEHDEIYHCKVYDNEYDSIVAVSLTAPKLHLIETLNENTADEFIDLIALQLSSDNGKWISINYVITDTSEKNGPRGYIITSHRDATYTQLRITNQQKCEFIAKRLKEISYHNWFYDVEKIVEEIEASTGKASYGGKIPDMNVTELEKTYPHTLEKPITVRRKFYGYIAIEYVQYAIVKDEGDALPKLVNYYDPTN